MKTNGIFYPWEMTSPEHRKGLFGGFGVTPSTQVKTQQTSGFLVATTPSKPDFGSGDREPTKSLINQTTSGASFFSIPPSTSANKSDFL